MSATTRTKLVEKLAVADPDLLTQILEETRQIAQRQAIPQVQPMELRSFAELERWAERAARSGMVPYAFKGKPDDIILAVQYGSEVGLRTMQSLLSIAVINGRPCMWGDAMLGLCKTHPAFASCEETISGEGEDMVAKCVIVRKGEPPIIRTFSVIDAKIAKLWNKKGRDGQDTPWVTNPKRMLQLRARGFATRDAFPDKLRGLISAEEAGDYHIEPTYTPFVATSEPAPVQSLSAPEPRRQTQGEFLDELERDLAAAADSDAVDAILARDRVQKAQDSFKNGAQARLDAIINAALKRTSPADDDGFPGVVTREDAA